MDSAEFDEQMRRIKSVGDASLETTRQMLENHLQASDLVHQREASRTLVRSAETILARPTEVPQ